MDRQTLSSSFPRARVAVAPPPRAPSARQPAPADARGLRARGAPDRRSASPSCAIAYGWQPELLDFGGGYPHERDPESGLPSGNHASATPEEYAEAVTLTLRTALADAFAPRAAALLEPGRRLVSNATVLLTRVGVVKRLADRVFDVGQRRREHEPLSARPASGLLLRDRPCRRRGSRSATWRSMSSARLA